MKMLKLINKHQSCVVQAAAVNAVFFLIVKILFKYERMLLHKIANGR